MPSMASTCSVHDLRGKAQRQQGPAAAAAGAQDSEGGVRIAERPVGKDGRCIPEVRAAAAAVTATAVHFYDDSRPNAAASVSAVNSTDSSKHTLVDASVSSNGIGIA